MLHLRNVIFFGIFLSQLQALAFLDFLKPSLSTTYRQETFKILTRLQELGIRDISCEDGLCTSPGQLKEELETIKFKELPTFQKDPASTRWGAFYDPAQKTIFLNKAAEHDAKMIGILGLHELLGATGRPEPEFKISMNVYLLLESAKTRSLEDYEEFVFLRMLLAFSGSRPVHPLDPNNMLVSSGGEEGGGVIVGGGGDTRTLKIRLDVYEGLKQYILDNSFLRVHLADTTIEIANENANTVSYEMLGTERIRRITVPQNLLKQRSVSGKNSYAVADIIWFIRSLHPEKSGLSVNEKILHPAVRNIR